MLLEKHFEKHIKEICTIVQAPVSAEAMSTTSEELIAEAKSLANIDPYVVVKIPMTKDGLKRSVNSPRGRENQRNLVFSPLQALMAAKAGATYVSPFVGRLDDVSHNGMALVERSSRSFPITCSRPR